MGFSDWTPQFTVNHPTMDEHHQKIFKLVNQLHEGIFSKKAKEVLGEILYALIDYTVLHFAEEESIMRQHNYPGYTQHKTEHEWLLAQVREFERKFTAGDNTFTPEMFHFLVSDWLVKHILGMDKMYAPFLKSGPPSATPHLL